MDRLNRLIDLWERTTLQRWELFAGVGEILDDTTMGPTFTNQVLESIDNGREIPTEVVFSVPPICP